jgi:hypothetical protein
LLRPELGEQLKTAKSVKFGINDWSIADLMNGRLGLSSPGSIGPAALVTAIISTTGGRGTLYFNITYQTLKLASTF